MSEYDTHVSSEQLRLYYENNGITDYPKRKNGYPNMTFKFNRHHINKIIESRRNEYINKKNKREKLIQEFYESYSDNTKAQECIICCEPISKNIAILECGHTFCLSCMVQHGRENNNCPCCRIEFTNKPKKVEHMTGMTLNEIISTLEFKYLA